MDRLKPDVVWIDSGINALSDAEEGKCVQALFNNLGRLMRHHGVRGVALRLLRPPRPARRSPRASAAPEGRVGSGPGGDGRTVKGHAQSNLGSQAPDQASNSDRAGCR